MVSATMLATEDLPLPRSAVPPTASNRPADLSGAAPSWASGRTPARGRSEGRRRIPVAALSSHVENRPPDQTPLGVSSSVMANKSSAAGSRSRDLFRTEVSSLLADLAELAADPGAYPVPAEPPAAVAVVPADTGGSPAAAAVSPADTPLMPASAEE